MTPESYRAAARRIRDLADRVDLHAGQRDHQSRFVLTQTIKTLAIKAAKLEDKHLEGNK